MNNQFDKDEDPLEYLRYLCSDIIDAQGKVAGWMRRNTEYHIRRHFPDITDAQLRAVITEFIGDAQPIF